MVVNKTRGNTPHELMLFFICGFKPQTLVKMGYNEMTVYRYRKNLIKSQERMIKQYMGGKYESSETKEN